jgi:hypothetical protein
MLRTYGNPKHNLCDRTVLSVISSVSWSTFPYFPESTAVRGGKRRRSNVGEGKSEA